MIKTLAIETSCDDTSVGIVQYNAGFFHCSLLHTYSQITEHQQYGGVVPEIAYRLHEEKIIGLIQQIGLDEIMSCDCITVTKEPGLPGSLVVGNAVASFLAKLYHKPLYRVNHIHGHIVSLLLERSLEQCPLPWVVLTVSGGHNEIYTVHSKAQKTQDGTSQILGDLYIERIGYSLDDAAGESFDKVARMLGGTYPGGPWIDHMASTGHKSDIKFKRILLDDGDNKELNQLNFSFSGMKSQVYNFLKKQPLETLTPQDIANICREFNECVSDILVEKIKRATLMHNSKTVGLVGGVSANDTLYNKLQAHLPNINTLRPTKKVYSTDNAAMIGVVGILEHQQNNQ